MRPQTIKTEAIEKNSPTPTDHPRATVLVIEPLSERREILGRFFASHSADIQTHFVATARQALGASQTTRFTCVTLTEQLPDYDSLSLISLLRDPSTLRQLPLVLILNERDDQATLDALRCGAHEVVVFSRLNGELLMEKVLSAVERHYVATAVAENRLQGELNALEFTRRQKILSEKLDELTFSLRAPLASMSEFISLAFDGVGGDISDQNKKYLALARGSCWSLEREISALYGISDVSNTLNEPHKTTVQIMDVLQLVVDELGPEACFLKADLVNAAQSDLPSVHADGLQICQAILQLASRALSIGGPGCLVALAAEINGRNGNLIDVKVLLQRSEAQCSDSVQTVPAAPKYTDRIVDQFEVKGCTALLEAHKTQLEVRIEGAANISVNFQLPIV